MSEMVERVARVLSERHSVDLAMGAIVWEDMARAAIEAMREPTEAMERKGDESDLSIFVWQAMIDEALK